MVSFGVVLFYVSVFFFFLFSMFMEFREQLYWVVFYFFFFLVFFLKFFFVSSETFFSCHFGFLHMDGMSVVFIFLSIWVCVLSFLSMFFDEYSDYLMLSFLSSFLFFLLVFFFGSGNVFFFFCLFELTLFPVFYVVVMWGSYKERVFSLYYFLLFTIITSIPLLLVVCSMLYMGFFNYLFLFMNSFFFYVFPSFLLLGLLLGFLSKLPLFGFHMWLPKAHVDAPVGGSMLLAGILLKLGGYGVLRLFLLFNYQVVVFLLFFLVFVGILGYFFSALICVRLLDLKVIIAFSSVSHMSVAFSGSVGGAFWGFKGAFLMFLGHGIVSPLLFYMVHLVSKFFNSRYIMGIKGFASLYFWLSLFFFFFLLFNMGVPPFINFFAEVGIMYSIFLVSFPLFFFVFLGFLFNGLYIFSLLGVFLQSKVFLSKSFDVIFLNGFVFFSGFLLIVYMTFFLDFFL
uniref:NADH-ubiquinone oxidoreductase chain 4 n=1 Tax=Rhopalaea idoneta TaxID=1712670 RepID=A0A173QSY0_9ASCI|nr:NADH dehydrogenase subunit 4 [Rhopalaea idoneta]